MQLTKKEYLLPIILLLLSFNINSQIEFDFRFNSTANETVRNFIQSTDSIMIGLVSISVPINDSTFKYNNLVLSLNQLGDTLIRSFYNEEFRNELHRIIQVGVNPVEYLLASITYPENSTPDFANTNFTFLNRNLETTDSVTYKLYTRENAVVTSGMLLLQDSSILYARSFLGWDGFWNMYLFRISNTGDSLQYNEFTGDSVGLINSLTYNYDSSAYWLHLTGTDLDQSTTVHNQCLVINENLELEAYYNYPEHYYSPYTSKLLPDGMLVSGGTYDDHPEYDELAIYLIDSTFNIIEQNKFTPPDTTSQGGNQAMDFYFPDSIFVAGTHVTRISWSTIPNWLVVGKFNSNMEMLDEIYIGGDASYYLMSTLATIDGCVLLAAIRYDYKTQDEENDAVMLKIRMDGNITSIQENKGLTVAKAIVYPDPGNDKVYIRTSLKGKIFKLFDSNGRNVLKCKVESLITSINTTNLIPGTYIWQVADDHQVLESGKWIKQ